MLVYCCYIIHESREAGKLKDDVYQVKVADGGRFVGTSTSSGELRHRRQGTATKAKMVSSEVKNTITWEGFGLCTVAVVWNLELVENVMSINVIVIITFIKTLG